MSTDQVALGVIVVGLLSGVIVASAGRAPVLGVQVVLDFLLAAGLIRLTGPQAWSTLGAVAAVIVVRQIAARGLHAASATRTVPGRPLVQPAGPQGPSDT